MFLPSTAKLPEYRIYFEFPFKNVGFDYAGPLYTRNVFFQIRKHINPAILFLLVQQQVIPILKWYQQNRPRSQAYCS